MRPLMSTFAHFCARSHPGRRVAAASIFLSLAFGLMLSAGPALAADDDCSPRTVSIDAYKIYPGDANKIGLQFEVDVRVNPACSMYARQCIVRGNGNGGGSCWVRAMRDADVTGYVTVWANGKKLLDRGQVQMQYGGNHIEIYPLGSTLTSYNKLLISAGEAHWTLQLP